MSARQQISALSALYGTGAAVEFANVCRQHGLVLPDTPTGDGAIHRVYFDGDKRSTRNGWYLLHLDGVPAGAFGHWRSGLEKTWSAGGSERMTAAERMRINAAIVEAKRQREEQIAARWAAARDTAAATWHDSHPADPEHPYLTRKGVRPHGLRQAGRLLLVPMRDADGTLWSLQSIAPDGEKRFRTGGRKQGLYYALGGPVVDKLCIAEGFATAASVHAATGQPVAVAFDAGNLAPVARTLRAKYPQAVITICADNDEQTEGNPGLSKANAAAAEIGGKVAIPPAGFNDFNDAARAGGNPNA